MLLLLPLFWAACESEKKESYFIISGTAEGLNRQQSSRRKTTTFTIEAIVASVTTAVLVQLLMHASNSTPLVYINDLSTRVNEFT